MDPIGSISSGGVEAPTFDRPVGEAPAAPEAASPAEPTESADLSDEAGEAPEGEDAGELSQAMADNYAGAPDVAAPQPAAPDKVAESSAPGAGVAAPAAADSQAIKRAQERFGQLIKEGHAVRVLNSQNNGGRPVTVVRPKDLKDGEPYNVQTHYHGDRVTPEHRNDGVANAIANDLRRNKTVYVLPEADNADIGQASYGGAFNQRAMTRDALLASGLEPGLARNKIVSGHSRGGTPLKQAFDTNTMDANRIKLLDIPSNGGSTARSLQAWRARGNNARVTFEDGVYGSNWRNVPGVEFIPGNGDHMDAVRKGLTR